PDIDVLLGSFSINLREFGTVIILLFLLDLYPYQFPGQGNHTYIMGRGGLCSYNIPDGQGNVVRISKKFLPTIFKTDFHAINWIFPIWVRHIGKPVKNRQFITAIRTASPIVHASSRLSVLTG